jgi:lipid-A-disaccharide synthase
LASTGTVTLECAWFRVPTLAFYRTSWSTYQIGKRIVTVSSLAMPNLLAGETVMPEFIQNEFTVSRLVTAAVELLRSPERRREIQEKLGRVVAQLGPPGAARRAAEHVLHLLNAPERTE